MIRPGSDKPPSHTFLGLIGWMTIGHNMPKISQVNRLRIVWPTWTTNQRCSARSRDLMARFLQSRTGRRGCRTSGGSGRRLSGAPTSALACLAFRSPLLLRYTYRTIEVHIQDSQGAYIRQSREAACTYKTVTSTCTRHSRHIEQVGVPEDARRERPPRRWHVRHLSRRCFSGALIRQSTTDTCKTLNSVVTHVRQSCIKQSI